MRGFAPRLQRLRSTGGAAMLGLVFGLNTPACAAPLLLALLGLWSLWFGLFVSIEVPP